ncbi:MAG: hypothetical protein FWG39_04160, partial [Alphaproteobacteria bacterium]|nr:hypothetical protein [Alphaproteobacteria bacterium]
MMRKYWLFGPRRRPKDLAQTLISRNQFYYSARCNNDGIAVVVICSPGGAGDKIMFLAWLSEMQKQFGRHVKFHIMTNHKPDMNRALFNGIPEIAGLYNIDANEMPDTRFDMLIELWSSATAVHYVGERAAEQPRIAKWIDSVRGFKPMTCGFNMYYLSMLRGEKRVQLYNRTGGVNVKPNAMPRPKLMPKALKILKRLGLDKQKFITIVRGAGKCDANSEAVKLWPIGHYKKFIKLFRKAYPEY